MSPLFYYNVHIFALEQCSQFGYKMLLLPVISILFEALIISFYLKIKELKMYPCF